MSLTVQDQRGRRGGHGDVAPRPPGGLTAAFLCLESEPKPTVSQLCTLLCPTRQVPSPLHLGKALSRCHKCHPVACYVREVSAEGSETSFLPPFREVTTSVTPNFKNLSGWPRPVQKKQVTFPFCPSESPS